MKPCAPPAPHNLVIAGGLNWAFDLSRIPEFGLHWVVWSWFANGSASDGRGGCITDMFYAEADPLNPVYVQTPYADRLRLELQSVESVR